ncbi:hypothetical protein [Litchfieldia alkalitelluris]|uniref:hypothetical protein n=1 Tax=Litchfieldia alkalitelluris TaxID=304268 RepID=UPI0009971CBB|nr:hypothetical protein [Litchfieldia alkalitelluris]
MKRSEWSDEQLEQLLTQMPPMKDNRNPQEIYQNISLQVKKKRKTTWVVPSIAAAAALILFFVLSPSLFNNLNSGLESSESSSDQERVAELSVGDQGDEEAGIASIKEEDSAKNVGEEEMTIMQEPSKTHLVNEEDLVNQTLLTFTVPVFAGQFYTTVSVLTENDGQTSVQKYNETLPLLNNLLLEKQAIWGIEPFAVDYLRFSEETDSNGMKNVIVDIPSETNTASFSSAEAGVFDATMTNSFRWLTEDYNHVVYMKDGKIGAEIGQSGFVTDSLEIEKNRKLGYFYLKNEGSEQSFLIYSMSPYKTIEEAFTAMRNPEGLGDFSLEPSIPTEAMFYLKEDEQGENLTVTFESPIEDNEHYQIAFEAILLTAKEFGFKTVTFEGNMDRVGNVILGERTTVPVAPNPIVLN